jgi:serine protease Do
VIAPSGAVTRKLLLILALFLVAGTAAAQQAGLPDFTELVRKYSPAVVNISTTQERPAARQGPGLGDSLPDLPEDHPFRDFLDRFRDDAPPAPPPGFDARSLGSGFIISPDGYVLTNNHVVEDASEIIVRLSDRREYVAELVGADPQSDVALLKIDAEGNLPVVEIGSSTDIEAGQWVLAIGSPFGFEHSVTAGVVSAKGRSLPRENYVPFIQTDVAINPGNSGGPLFNLAGEVVGINSHIYSRTGGFMGVSFAIPIELAMDVAKQLRTTGKVSRGWLGVLIQDVTRELAESFSMARPYGALVAQIVPGSPAAESGLQVGDIIVEFNGREVPTSGALPPMVGRIAAGKEVEVGIVRNGERQSLELRIGELPEDPRAALGGGSDPSLEPAPEPDRVERLGLRLKPLDEETRQQLGLSEGETGLVVTEITGGPARDAQLRVGDVITQFGGEPVGSVEALRERVSALAPGTRVPVLVRLDAGPRFFALAIPE